MHVSASTLPGNAADSAVHAAANTLFIHDLQVRFNLSRGVLRAVNGVSLSLRQGETLGVVGESGSGKSVTALAVLGLDRKSTRLNSSHT